MKIIYFSQSDKWYSATHASTGQKGIVPSNFIKICDSASTSGKLSRVASSGSLEKKGKRYSLLLSPTAPQSPQKPLISSADPTIKVTLADGEYPFDDCTGPENESFSSKGELIGVSLVKLIGITTGKEQHSGTSAVQSLLLTYRSVTNAATMMYLLKRRFNVPSHLDKSLQEAIKIRVWSFLREWISDHFYDFDKSNVELFHSVDLFVDEICHSSEESVQKSGELLKKIWGNKKVGTEFSILAVDGVKPKIVQPDGPIHDITDAVPLEVARQMALLEFDFFKKIMPWECYGLAWSKKDGNERSPNITQFINNFNKVGDYVKASILEESSAKKREKIIKHFLKIAEECYSINNFNSMMEIVSALGSSPVSRLKKSWNEKTEEQMTKFAKLLDKNFAGLRELIRNTPPPVLPYVGIYLKDLTFIDEGNEDRIEGHPNLVNWSKMQMQAQVIQQIRLCQKKGFSFNPSFNVQAFISGFDKRMSDEEAYARSLEIEPREK
eukprot:TRINITY_DN321_c0_g1_i5.p1 TRINITY_DN321_c0_g1~~TRINITY_DN321_c0_g1_i5.p1  ORF type:complete len:496 (-),score=172.71 TRINITY_DN321_c0_g1_i5:137-1624(-)